MRAVHAALEVLNVALQLLDDGVTLLQVLVQTVALRNQFLLPGTESLFFDLDLLREPLAESLFLLLKLGIVQLTRTGFAKLAGFHLLCAVGLVVDLLRGVDEVEHVSPDEDGAELLEIAVLLILHFGHTPCILTALDGAVVAGLNILFGSNDRERHGRDQAASVLQARLVILLQRWGVDLDALCLNDSSYLSNNQ